MALTLEDVKRHIRVDYPDDDSDIDDFLLQAEIIIDKCCGTGYKNDEKGLKISELLYKKMVNDMYENRGMTVNNGSKRDNITSDLFDILSLFGSGDDTSE